MIIRSVKITGGFLDGHTFHFSPDLNCLLGGTGAGKSLLIEIIRFALDQQTSATDSHISRAKSNHDWTRHSA
jgi:DNA repair ATPase RecN